MKYDFNKKAENEITGVGRNPDDKLVVQKAKPLNTLWRSTLTLAEFKLIDVYLARIDSHHPERRRVRLERGEVESILGVTKINKADLVDRVKHLMQPLIINDDDGSGFLGFSLFSEARCRCDRDGIWQIDLECSRQAMTYIFNVDSLGYYRYRLRSIALIRSRYSYILFCYLESNRYRGEWSIGLDDLKKLLNCDAATYTAFKDFNKSILRKAQTEISSKTDCKFLYKPVRKGRTVSAIKITLEPLPDLEPRDPAQIQIDDLPQSNQDTVAIGGPDDPLAIIDDATQHTFERSELAVVAEYVTDKCDDDLAIYSFCSKAFATFLDAAAKAKKRGKPIKNAYRYYLKLIKAANE